MAFKHKFFIPFILILFLFSVFAIAENTQQYSKIFLDPFYKVNMNSNQNYTYNLNINPPDKIGSVINAMLSFQIYITPTVTYTLFVNDKSCNNPTFTISTTFAGAGLSIISFDCSNIITKAGNYKITLKADKNSGSSYGWLELTYMSSILGEIKQIHGTEYAPGESGKMFLQFLNADKKAINNSACLIDIWYSNNTKFVNNSAMTYLDEGIYYYNFVAPSVLGVYPATADCFIPYEFANVIVRKAVYENWESNTFSGGTGWSSSFNGTGWDFYNAFLASSGCYEGTYCGYVSGASGSTEYLERGFISPQNTQKLTLCYAVKQTGFGNGDSTEIDLFDGNWHTLNTFTNTLTTNTWYSFCNNLTVAAGYNLDKNAILFGIYAVNLVSPSKNFYWDNISIDVHYSNTSISNISEFQELRGAGEIHISNKTATIINNFTNIINNTFYFNNTEINNFNNTFNLTTIIIINNSLNITNFTEQINEINENVTQFTSDWDMLGLIPFFVLIGFLFYNRSKWKIMYIQILLLIALAIISTWFIGAEGIYPNFAIAGYIMFLLELIQLLNFL